MFLMKFEKKKITILNYDEKPIQFQIFCHKCELTFPERVRTAKPIPMMEETRIAKALNS
jgi:hypothetical protein